MFNIKLFIVYEKTFSRYERSVQIKKVPQKGEYILLDDELFSVFFVLTDLDEKFKKEKKNINGKEDASYEVYIEPCKDPKVKMILSTESKVVPTQFLSIQDYDEGQRD
jgi:hypothetical protein